jgi:hypothetical protein
MTIIRAIIGVLLWVWQLPQNLAGICVLWFYGIQGKVITVKKMPGFTHAYYLTDIKKDKFDQAVSLGDFLFLEKQCHPNTLLHETGHSRQSKVLGPLYFLVIGLPSFVWALEYERNPTFDYYSFYTEKWADRLGGVTR